MYNCGYIRTTDLNRPIYHWYPTTEPERPYQYDLFRWTQVASGAKPIDGPAKVLVFSHGAPPGFGHQSTFICETLAREGYTIIATDHEDLQNGVPSFFTPFWWTEQSCEWRRLDIVRLLDFAFRTLRVSKAGMIGHSLGGYTALAMSGALNSWHDPRVEMAIGLSPYIDPLWFIGDFSAITIPVHVQSGFLDFGPVWTLGYAVNRFAGPKDYVWIDGARHFAWSDVTCLGYASSQVCVENSARAKMIVMKCKEFLSRYFPG